MVHKEIIEKLSLENKLKFLTGIDMNQTYPLSEAGVEGMKCYDGPYGLKMPFGGDENAAKIRSAFPACAGGDYVVSTAFPNGCALGATWNKELVKKVGKALGDEDKAYGVNVALDPSVNIKRHPLCGRNFEYMSEDPVVAGELGASYVEGIQENDIAACPKHFIANNQERGRFSVSSEMDERTMREIYLKPFERIVKQSHPWSIMCAYNRINGIYASENRFLMDEVLRKEWGFDGVIVSDWGSVHERARALNASVELCMPYQEEDFGLLMRAYERGEITDKTIDGAVDRLLTLYDRTHHGQCGGVGIDFEAHHQVALEAAREAVTLLKNEAQALPLDGKNQKRILVVGETAKHPYWGGDGSARVMNAPHRENPLDEMQRIAGPDVEFEYWGDEKLNTFKSNIAEMETKLRISLQKCDTMVVFASQDYSCYSETMDRNDIELPPYIEHTIRTGYYAGKKVIVVLNVGSAISTWKWRDYADAILVSWMAGQGMGTAVAETLFGFNNPSGKLAETFPKNLSDVLSLKNYPGDFKKVVYDEKLLVGYRHFDTNHIEPDYEFGYGLSYTTFEYYDLQINDMEVSFTLKNTGNVAGKETAQIYLAAPKESWLSHPTKELKAFEKVFLQPGEERRITITLREEDFKSYNIMLHDWMAETGEYQVLVGASSRNLPLQGTIAFEETLPYTFTSDLY